MKRAVAAIASLLTLAAVGVAAPPASAEDMTTITMKVTGCEGCAITPVQALNAGSAQASIWTGTKAVVKNGRVVFTVPTAKTAGMSFNLDARWPVDMDAVPVIVTQYKGAQPGQRVTKRQAKAFDQATACWAGTTSTAVTLRVMVRRVWMPGFAQGSGKTKVPLAWMVPTAETSGGFADADKGVIAQQEAWYCP